MLFRRKDKSLIVIDISFYTQTTDKIKIKQIPLAIDTGCTDTVLNKSYLPVLGLNYEDGKKTEIWTGSGKEKARSFVIPIFELEELNYVLYDFKIICFDVEIEKDEYGGYLGLDFFENKKILFDLLNKTLDIT